MGRIVLVAGHGDGDPGAVGNGTYEARETRRIVRALETRIRGVTVYPTNRNLFRARDWNFFRSGDQVYEIHLNAHSDKAAHGSEILIRAGFSVDAIHRALASALGGFFRLRHGDGIWHRADLQNMNEFARRGIWYSLPEICFITNVNDMRIYNQNFDAIMDRLAAAISGGNLQSPVNPNTIFIRDTMGVATSSVNIRKRRDVASRAVGFIRRGVRCNITGRTGGTNPWTRIKLNDRVGWIRTKRVAEYFVFGAITRSARFTSDIAGNNQIGILGSGTNVTILGSRDTRVRISHRNRIGWVNQHVIRNRVLVGHLRGAANFRDSPSLNQNHIIKRVARNKNVRKFGRSGDFTLVEVDGVRGWITTSWLRNGRALAKS